MNEARKRYYQTWASKPGNLERKAAECRETTALKRSLGVCTHCKNDAIPGRALCETCAMISRERKALARNLKREQKALDLGRWEFILIFDKRVCVGKPA